MQELRLIERNSTVLLTGYGGMVGSELRTLLERNSFKEIFLSEKDELDLCDQVKMDAYFAENRPDYVFMVAARVSGIAANIADPVGFTVDNLRMQMNLFGACCKYRTRKNLFLGSSCIYPREPPQPMKEEYLLTGSLEPTNEGYAL